MHEGPAMPSLIVAVRQFVLRLWRGLFFSIMRDHSAVNHSFFFRKKDGERMDILHMHEGAWMPSIIMDVRICRRCILRLWRRLFFSIMREHSAVEHS
ncbi:hypothetical protein CEXT_478331 [Caerostris extrusa]|uniref:Uncharacterized protein n=1 Tax=Caerostris extrusa TaxID=172846 RepID=A0AAV4UJ76_CAEEX|nr:hypothetical protein CEXT_478331 [Caerostris extrusa]